LQRAFLEEIPLLAAGTLSTRAGPSDGRGDAQTNTRMLLLFLLFIKGRPMVLLEE